MSKMVDNNCTAIDPNGEKTWYEKARESFAGQSDFNCGAMLPKLEDEIKADCCTGWMKDYEWRHERESRICLRVGKADGPNGLWSRVSPELIEAMKFTFSPWLPREYEEDVKRIIVNALKVTESRRGAKAREYESRLT